MAVSPRDYRVNVLGITQKTAAKLLGISPGTLSKWECDPDQMRIKDVKRLASHYGFYWKDFF